MSRVFILTLHLERELQSRLNELRDRYFPPSLNYLQAHVTLFHALEDEHAQVWRDDLKASAEQTSIFAVRVETPYSLGRGVGLRINAPEIGALHKNLQIKWQGFLRPQDLQKRHAHCTVQNKVDPQRARETLAELSATWTPMTGHALGLELHEYLGGPWRSDRLYLFR